MICRHTQVGTVIIVAVLGAALVMLVLLLSSAGSIPLPALLVSVMTAVALSLFSWLTVEIQKNTLTCRFGVDLIRKSILLSDIDHASAVLLPGGWDGGSAGSREGTGCGMFRASGQ